MLPRKVRDPGQASQPHAGAALRSSGDTPASTGNVANIITIIRILLAPVFVALLLVDNGQFGPLRYVALVLFIVAIVDRRGWTATSPAGAIW